MHMSELGFLSPDGRCKSFDASGDGYARGEGVLALLLKPLNQAIRDQDPIRSVIRGTRINQDGRTNGITLPSSEAQASNLRALYKDDSLRPGDVQYLEAHVGLDFLSSLHSWCENSLKLNARVLARP